MFNDFIVLVLLLVGCCYLVNASLGLEGVDEETQSRIQNILNSNPKLEVYGSYGNKIYFNTSETMSHVQATKYCSNNSMKLVSVRSQEELVYLTSRNVPRRKIWTSGTLYDFSYRWEGETVPGVVRCLDNYQLNVFFYQQQTHMFLDRYVEQNHLLCEHGS